MAWRLAEQAKLPRAVFVNKLDRERASFGRTLDDMKAKFGAGVAPLELPIGEEASFRGVVDLLTDTAMTYDGTTGKGVEGAVPDEVEGEEHSVHDALIEGIEWPSGSSRSVVVIALRDKEVVPNFLSVFLKTSQSSDVSQSVSVLHGSRFTSYRIGNDVYHVGTLSPWIKLNMLFERYQWLMVACILFFCFLIAVILRSILRKKARSRLQGNG